VAAPRKYSEQQRHAIARLHQDGRSSPEIVELCASGEAGVDPFQIPRRSVDDIAMQMERREQGSGESPSLLEVLFAHHMKGGKHPAEVFALFLRHDGAHLYDIALRYGATRAELERVRASHLGSCPDFAAQLSPVS
jgi:hypothetical protein